MTNLTRWTRPDSYAGTQYPEYFLGLGQHRDSDTLERCNFAVALDMLGGESDCQCDAIDLEERTEESLNECYPDDVIVCGSNFGPQGSFLRENDLEFYDFKDGAA